MNNNGKAKVIRNQDCKNITELEQNYAGLWRALGLQVTRTNKGEYLSAI